MQHVWGEKRCILGFGGETKWKENTWKNQAQMGGSYYNGSPKSGTGAWTGLSWSRTDTWQALVNTVMNLRFHKMREISWLAEDLLASQEGLCSLKLVSKLVSLSVSSRLCPFYRVLEHRSLTAQKSFILQECKGVPTVFCEIGKFNCQGENGS